MGFHIAIAKDDICTSPQHLPIDLSSVQSPPIERRLPSPKVESSDCPVNDVFAEVTMNVHNILEELVHTSNTPQECIYFSLATPRPDLDSETFCNSYDVSRV